MGRYSKFPKVDRSVPAHGATAAERLGLTGRVQPVEVAPVVADPEPSTLNSQPEVEVPDLSEMTVPEVLEWVGDDEERRVAALSAEENGRDRKGVVNALRR